LSAKMISTSSLPRARAEIVIAPERPSAKA
jgi:hypothetical protein